MIALVTALHLLTLCLFGPLAAGALIALAALAPQLRKESHQREEHDGLALEAPPVRRPARALATERAGSVEATSAAPAHATSE